MEYGLLVFVAYLLLTSLIPGNVGRMVFWGVGAAQLAWGAALVWRRTRLPFAAAALVIGSVGFGVAIFVTAIGYDLFALSVGSVLLCSVFLVTGPLCFWIESRRHPKQWQRWREHMFHMGAWDIVMGRHVPNLLQDKTGT